MSDPPAALGLRIGGRVQGVWFRAWTVRAATELGLSGWVRNRSDGTVEVLAIGPPDALERFVAACHRGPPRAEVSSVARTPAADDGSRGFRQLPTE